MDSHLVTEGVSLVTKRNEKLTPNLDYLIIYGKIVSLEEGIYSYYISVYLCVYIWLTICRPCCQDYDFTINQNSFGVHVEDEVLRTMFIYSDQKGLHSLRVEQGDILHSTGCHETLHLTVLSFVMPLKPRKAALKKPKDEKAGALNRKVPKNKSKKRRINNIEEEGGGGEAEGAEGGVRVRLEG